jgi:hypothetical protein
MNCIVRIDDPEAGHRGTGVFVDCSAFGLSSHCILTNNHVVETKECAGRVCAYFPLGGMKRQGTYNKGKPIGLKWINVASPREEGSYDFTVLEMRGDPPHFRGVAIKPLPIAPSERAGLKELDLTQEILLYQFPSSQSTASGHGVGDKAIYADGETARKMVACATIARHGDGLDNHHYHANYYHSPLPVFKLPSYMNLAFVNTESDDHIVHQGSSGCPIIKIDGNNPRVVGLANGGNHFLTGGDSGSYAKAYGCKYLQGFGISSTALIKEMARLCRLQSSVVVETLVRQLDLAQATLRLQHQQQCEQEEEEQQMVGGGGGGKGQEEDKAALSALDKATMKEKRKQEAKKWLLFRLRSPK